MPKSSGGGGNGGRSGGGGGAQPVNDVLPQAKSLGLADITHGNVDLTKPINIKASGDTYSAKSSLKDEGFKFNAGDKSWTKALPAGTSANQLQDKLYQASRWTKNKKGLRFDVSNE